MLTMKKLEASTTPVTMYLSNKNVACDLKEKSTGAKRTAAGKTIVMAKIRTMYSDNRYGFIHNGTIMARLRPWFYSPSVYNQW